MKDGCQVEALSSGVIAGLSRLRSAYKVLANVHDQAEASGRRAINRAPLRLAGRLLDELEELIMAGAPAAQVILEIDRLTLTLDLAASELSKDAEH